MKKKLIEIKEKNRTTHSCNSILYFIGRKLKLFSFFLFYFKYNIFLSHSNSNQTFSFSFIQVLYEENKEKIVEGGLMSALDGKIYKTRKNVFPLRFYPFL